MKSQRFSVYHQGDLIGHSYLEEGDAPMGCANGVLITTATFTTLKHRFERISKRSDPVVLFGGFEVREELGDSIECKDVVIYDSVMDIPAHVDVIGMMAERYEQLFPHHLEAYDKLWKRPADD
ncbi:MAG: hypothetical protein ACRBB0_01185 [Pelagimonas sp.]|uniref:hypothetical protein n=1 Tax=Pelagimonas sp. TaxID=2073170 RepID=UPI003D6BF742